MLIDLPKDRSALRSNLVALRTKSDLSAHRSAWWPYRYDDKHSEWLVHVSSVLYISKLPEYRGITHAAREYVKGYFTEARKTLGPERLKPTDGYDWSKHLSDAWDKRDYQCAGMERMYARCHNYSKGTLIADDVGLGKTIQAIGVMSRLFAEGGLSTSRPAIAVTISPAKAQWGDEVRKFANPELSVSVVSGDRRERMVRMRPGKHVYVLNWEMLRLPQFALAVDGLFARAGMAVLDETYAIANHATKTTRRTIALCKSVPRVVPFNATPIENALLDVYPQIRLVDSGLLGDYWHFADRYVVFNMYDQPIRYRHISEVRTRLSGAYLRRVKSEVNIQMPKVIAQTRVVEMSARQSKVYRSLVEDFGRSKTTGAVAMAELYEVQRAALTADIEDIKADAAKIEDLDHLLRGELSGERVIVFTKFKTVATYAAKRLKDYRPMIIAGGIDNIERDAIRRRFESTSGAGRLLIGTDAMARALNLQAAGVVVNLDLPWNHSRLRQRVGRVARYGQRRESVLCISYVAKVHGSDAKTIDDYFIGKIESKRKIADDTFGSDDVNELGKPEHFDVSQLRAYLTGRNIKRKGAKA